MVVGGGSGHYPAFCGVVGPGFADGAVVGNIFTSPSATEAASVARAAHGDAGVLLITGNYAGDVMNFGLATRQLRSEGIDARYLVVTDDIASAAPEDAAKRRGIAGDFTVFRCASAAAEEGHGLDDVERVARQANDATRTLGVAFDGCTMPGADRPLFTVTPGTMDLGLGIHGEPGVASHALPTAEQLAGILVDGVLAEKPDGAMDRVAVILNGLGRTKYEELFVVWKTVAALLARAGLNVVQPEVGELVTSLDMAGCSLTVTWLDEELERLWTSPADTPAYRKGQVTASSYTLRDRSDAPTQTLEATTTFIEADEAARMLRSASLPTRWWRSPPGCPTRKPNSAASTPWRATAITVAAWSVVPRRPAPLRPRLRAAAAERKPSWSPRARPGPPRPAAHRGCSGARRWPQPDAGWVITVLRLTSTWPRRCAPDMTR